jgi:hypothetical protein
VNRKTYDTALGVIMVAGCVALAMSITGAVIVSGIAPELWHAVRSVATLTATAALWVLPFGMIGAAIGFFATSDWDEDDN